MTKSNGSDNESAEVAININGTLPFDLSPTNVWR